MLAHLITRGWGIWWLEASARPQGAAHRGFGEGTFGTWKQGVFKRSKSTLSNTTVTIFQKKG